MAKLRTMDALLESGIVITEEREKKKLIIMNSGKS